MWKVVLTMVGVAVLLAAATFRFGLIEVKPALWFLLAGCLLMLIDMSAKTGFFATTGAILLVLGGAKAIWPKTSAATANAQVVADLKIAENINAWTAPKSIRCDKESQPEYRDPVTNEVKVFYVVNLLSGRVECSDRTGFSNGRRYEPVTEDFIAIIKNQEPPPPPVPFKPKHELPVLSDENKLPILSDEGQ